MKTKTFLAMVILVLPLLVFGVIVLLSHLEENINKIIVLFVLILLIGLWFNAVKAFYNHKWHFFVIFCYKEVFL